MKIIEYTIVTTNRDEATAEMVNEFIKAGWQPYGAPSIHAGWSSQAMVKYEEATNEAQP